MDFRELQYISAIAEKGTISAAADALFIAQPTLSRFLQNHEAALGTKLFKRMNGKLIPTYSGERYLFYANQILNLYKQMDQELSDISSQRRGRLFVAGPKHRLDGIIQMSILKFKSIYPEIEVNLQELSSAERTRGLIDGKIDLSIVYGQPNHSDIISLPLLDEEFVLCMPENHPLAAKAIHVSGRKYPVIDFKDISRVPFIMQPETSSSFRIARQIFEKLNIKPNVVLTTVDLNSTLLSVIHGYGFSITPDSFVKSSSLEKQLQYFSIQDADTRLTLYLAYNKNTYTSNYMINYIQILKDMFFEKYHQP